MRRGKLLLVVGVFFALLAGLLTFVMLQQPEGKAEEPARMTKVAVAVRSIPAGVPVEASAVELQDWPADMAPADAVANLADLNGKYAKSEIYTGQAVRSSMVANATELAQSGDLASALIPVGMVAYPFPISELSGVAYALNTGDHVDVLITLRFLDVDQDTQVQLPVNQGSQGGIQGTQIPRLVSQLTIQNIAVLKVGSWYTPPEPAESQQQEGQPAPTPPPPAIVTLLMPQQDALVLQFAREAGATIELALRNPTDQEVITTESVTLDYMLARFNITVPIKKPQSLESLSPD
jgi:Flp pilus assembly protein CpaB